MSTTSLRHISPWRSLLKATGVAVMLTAVPYMHGQNVRIESKLDSATLMMGRVTSLNVTVVKPSAERGRIVIPSDSMTANVEIVGEAAADTTSLGNGIEEIKRRIILQSFDSGVYVLKPILYVSPLGDTIASDRPVLKVIPVNVDSLTTIHDYADAQEGEHRFFDFLPDFMTTWWFWLIVGVVLAAAGIILYFHYAKKGNITIKLRSKPEEPPYERAVRSLNDLRSQHLCEQGREKEFYTRLTDILRVYLDKRFHINAMEMTSSQILRALESNEATRLPRLHMSQLLEIADFVKFAAQRPLPDDNVKAFNNAMQFVEDTKPVEPVTDANSNASQSTPQQTAPQPSKKS